MSGVQTPWHSPRAAAPEDPWAEVRARREAEDDGEPLGPSEVADLRDELIAEVSKAVIGQRKAI